MMIEEKKILLCIEDFKVNNAGGDLTKQWFVYYNVEGKRYKKYGKINSFHTKAARMRAAKELILVLVDIPVTIKIKKDKLFEELYEYLEDNKGFWRKKTYQSVKSKLDVLFEKVNGKLTQVRIQKFFKWLSVNRSMTTYNHYHQILKFLLKGINKTQLLDGIRRVKAHKIPALYFQKHQVNRLKKYISEHDPQLWLFIKFIFYTFIRPGEIRQLRVNDVLFEEAKIIVRANVSKNKKQQYVAIPNHFINDLEHLKYLSPNDYIFKSKRDFSKPIGINTMSSRHRKILNKLGFGIEYKLYSWKHTGAVFFIQNGGRVKELQIQLRHHSLDQVDAYLRQMGITDLDDLRINFPEI